MSSKAASFVKFAVQEGKLEEVVAALKAAATGYSQLPGVLSLTFAKTGAPNSRTTQLFINYVDNARLDGMGFAPFGEVVGKGMDVVRKIYNCGEKPNQGQIQSAGNSYLDKSFPDLSKIVSARVVTSKEEV